MDVWFDSGSSWAGVLGGLKGGITPVGLSSADGALGAAEAASTVSFGKTPLNFPADLYLEGSDQHRGWFQSSLLTAVAVTGGAPYRRVLTHGFVLDEKGRKMSKSLGNVVDPAVLVEGGKNEKQEPAYGADVLRLWVSSVDYSADVPLGPGIVKQLADVYRKVRNTARYLLGNLHDFDPRPQAEGGHAVPIAELPLLDRWMLQRTAALIDAVSADFERFEFYRFFQALQNFCVVDLSNVYLDIAKDRLYVSAADSFRRRSCQTVLHLVVERLAGLIAPVLCHMAEDIWQNLPYPVAETSVFERGWPTVPDDWRAGADGGYGAEADAAVRELLFTLRPRVNRLLEACRQQAMAKKAGSEGSGEGQDGNGAIGSSLEAQVQLELGEAGGSLAEALALLEASPHLEVDNLADWLLVSALRLGGEPPSAVLAEASDEGITLLIARAEGEKCERCWHYETDIGQHAAHPTVCGRCVAVLEG
jgi:isoleucyl-tRNA synthetase